MNISNLIIKNRSYRRFSQERRPTAEELSEMINSARCASSAANLQRLRFALITDNQVCCEIFHTLAFAGYLKEWQGPLPEERPTAYIVILTAKEPDINVGIDMGIAAEAILLTGCEMGFGGCMFRSFKREVLNSILSKEGYSPELVIALGVPSEHVYITDAKDGDIKYYRDKNDAHAVPKLSLSELII